MSDGPEMAFLGGSSGPAYFTLGHIGILEGKKEFNVLQKGHSHERDLVCKTSRLGPRTRIFHIARIGHIVLLGGLEI